MVKRGGRWSMNRMIHQSVSLISVERKDGASISSCTDEVRSQTASPSLASCKVKWM